MLALEPDNYQAHDNLGAVYSAQGLKQEAVKEFRLSLAIKPDQAMAHSNIGRIFARRINSLKQKMSLPNRCATTPKR